MAEENLSRDDVALACQMVLRFKPKGAGILKLSTQKRPSSYYSLLAKKCNMGQRKVISKTSFKPGRAAHGVWFQALTHKENVFFRRFETHFSEPSAEMSFGPKE